MLNAIVGFDLGRYFRSISTYIYFLLLGAIAFLLMAAAAGAFASASVVMGGGKVLVNSPYKGRRAALVLVAVEKRGRASGRVRMKVIPDFKSKTIIPPLALAACRAIRNV